MWGWGGGDTGLEEPAVTPPPPRSPGVPLHPHPLVAGAGPPVPPPKGPPRSSQLFHLVWGPQLPCRGPSG